MTAAADRAKAAEVTRLRIEGDWLVYETGEHNCGVVPDGHYGAHEPGCGLEPVMTLAELGELLDASTSTGARQKAAELAGEHQHWCHGEAHAECCGAGDCDCGVTERRESIAAALSAARADAAADRDRAWRTAVEGLAKELDADGCAAQDRTAHMDRTDENVRHHAAERRHARVAIQAAARLRGLDPDNSEEGTA